MTLAEWEQEKDRELDEQLTALFQSTQAPVPSAGFASRTINAVRLAPLPQGRRPLRRSWIVRAGWWMLLAAATIACYGVLVNQRLAAGPLSWIIALVVRAGMRFVQLVHTSSMVFDAFATTSRIVSHAMSTRQATAGLMMMTLVAALSLSMLNRLLVSDKESSSW
jgi:hypothetical protein